MLIVTGGTGSLITYSGNSKKIPFKVKIKEKIPLRKGSIAYVPAGTLHTHGSKKKECQTKIFSHRYIALMCLQTYNLYVIWNNMLSLSNFMV